MENETPEEQQKLMKKRAEQMMIGSSNEEKQVRSVCGVDSCCQYRWVTIGLATLGMVIMNSMRVNVSVSVIMGREEVLARAVNCSNVTDDVLPDIGWPSLNIAFLHSVFYIGYLITQVPAGVLAYKLSSHSIFGLGIVLSSVLNMLLPLTLGMQAFWLVCLIRFLQGLSEGFVWPASYALLHNWSPLRERNLLATVLAAGAVAGAIIGFPLAGLVMQVVDWRFIFYGNGTLGVLWFILWRLIIYEKPDHHPNISEEELIEISRDKIDMSKQEILEVPWKSIAASLPFAAICACHSAKGWVYILLLTQIPAYMAVFELSVIQSGLFSSLPFVVRLVCSCSSGLVADAILRKQWMELTTVRKLLNTSGLAVESVCFFALFFIFDGLQALACLTIGFGLGGVATAGWQINHLDLAPQYAGILMGLSSCFGNIAGIISPLVAGLIVEKSRNLATYGKDDLAEPVNVAIYGWQMVFLISAVIVAVCCIFYLVGSSGERQPWAEPAKLVIALNGAPTVQYIDDLPQSAQRRLSGPPRFNTYGLQPTSPQNTDEHLERTASGDGGGGRRRSRSTTN